MLHIDPFMTQMQLLGLFAQGLNGPFAIRETLRLSAESENSEPLICRQSVIKIFQDNVNRLVVSFLSLDGDYSHQRCVRTHILNQATFMAATGTTEGREFLEDLLTCRDYALQSHVLTCLGDMEARAVQALHVIGEHRNNLERLFHQSDAIELAEIALVSMRRIAQSFSSLKPQDRLAIAPLAVIDGLRTCLTDSGLDDIAELLR